LNISIAKGSIIQSLIGILISLNLYYLPLSLQILSNDTQLSLCLSLLHV
jgi:hypothetical protein